jgi:two-component system osmolarity sensor histidine kinase EnvZ
MPDATPPAEPSPMRPAVERSGTLAAPLLTRAGWLGSGLFWRTFFLLAFLIATSMGAWVASYRFIERTPRGNQIAAQVVSMVTITRAALAHSAPDLRRELLFDLASNEGIRIYPLENDDRVEPPAETTLMPIVREVVREKLGSDTRFAGSVNDAPGFWVSFKIADDDYWLRLDRERVAGTSGLQWLGWAAITLFIALLGAAFISRLINLPLARLTAVARAIAKGRQPELLPESGPAEIRDANHSFNQMVDDLNRVESDRAVVLAGISHDLRTPLARMQLEVEMAGFDTAAREGMQSDLHQMDAIIGQFLDYARPTDSASFTPVDLAGMLHSVAHDAGRINDLRITCEVAEGVRIMGNDVDLKRVFNNLLENARRYGRTADTGILEIDIGCSVRQGSAIVTFSDHGAGVPAAEIERLLRPFTRLDTARGQANGSGLGLAIVERVVKRHFGALRVDNRVPSGLQVTLVFPLAAAKD